MTEIEEVHDLSTDFAILKQNIFWKIQKFSSLHSSTKYYNSKVCEVRSPDDGKVVTKWYLCVSLNSNSSYPDYVTLTFNYEGISRQFLLKYEICALKNGTEQVNRSSISSYQSVNKSSPVSFTIGSPFLSKAAVLDANNKYFDKNGTLTICAEVSFGFDYVKYGNKIPIYLSNSGMKNLNLQNFCEHLYNNKSLSDVTLILKKEKVPAHKIILSAHSQYFARAFEGDFKESKQVELTIPEEDERVFKTMLKYFYTNELTDIDSDTALKLLVLANKYDVKDLMELCSEVLMKSISVANCLEILSTVDLISYDSLKKKIFTFLRTHSAELMKTEEWDTLSKNNSQIIIEVLSYFLKND